MNDELTAELNITTSWLHEAVVTIRQHELQRLELVASISRRGGNHATRNGRLVEHARTE